MRKGKKNKIRQRPQTPTPWSFFPCASSDKTFVGRAFTQDGTHGVFVRAADAKRTVLCVNACAGLTDEQLRTLPGTFLDLFSVLNERLNHA